MKKDNRDCGMPYPVYPPYQGMNMVPQFGMPYQGMNMGMNMGMPMMNYPTMTTTTTNISNTTNNIEQQLNNIEQEINNLDRRISNLENIYNSSNLSANKYSSSNYQMM